MVRRISLLLAVLALSTLLVTGCGGGGFVFGQKPAATAVQPAAVDSAAASRQAPAVPASFYIQGVPYYQQIQAHGCGAASLQMVLNYWGPFIDQKEVYNAARTDKGTALPDLARAAQFSAMSTPAGHFFPGATGQGYANRGLGYAGFFYASPTPWLDQLKAVVAQGYPVVVLTDWLPGVYGPHYRVITGYDDAEGVLIVNDPWAREFKNDFHYNDSAQQRAVEKTGNGEFEGWKWSYADFLAVWKLPADDWGIPGYAYGAVVVAPWKIALTVPIEIRPGEAFDLTIEATYPCPAPFGAASFPAYPASGVTLALDLPAGITAVDGRTSLALADLQAGQSSSVTVSLKAEAAGTYQLGATVSGLVSGSLAAWRKYPAYSYTDRIGGTGTAEVTVRQ